MRQEQPKYPKSDIEKLGNTIDGLKRALIDELEPSIKFATKTFRDFGDAAADAWNLSWISMRWYNLKYGLINLWRWRRTIWEDRDWDRMYLLALMMKKIEQMETCERKWSMHVSAPRHARQLMICRLLIERIEKDDYLPYSDPFNGHTKSKPFYLSLYRGQRSDVKEALDVDGFIRHYPILHSESYKHEEYMKQQDYNFLFKIMRTHIQEW